MLAPPPLSADSSITSVGTMIDNPGLRSDGGLSVEICAATVCRSGRKLLAGSVKNTFFQIPLDSPLPAPGGVPLRLTFTHQNASHPISLRVAPADSGQAQQFQGPSGVIPGRSLQLAFEYGTALSGMRKLYTDSLLDIWELPNPAPYFAGDSRRPLHAFDDATGGRYRGMHRAGHPDAQRALYARLASGRE